MALVGALAAVTGGVDQVVWSLAAYILIHQVEGNVIMPQIEKRTVYIPPALMLIAIAGMGAPAGLLGFVFAASMLVVIFVIVEKAYARDALKEDVVLEKGATTEGEKR
jgi:predicted PurR-regulated permease PerM